MRAGRPFPARRPTPRTCPRRAPGRFAAGRGHTSGSRTPGRRPAVSRPLCGRSSPGSPGSVSTVLPARPAWDASTDSSNGSIVGRCWHGQSGRGKGDRRLGGLESSLRVVNLVGHGTMPVSTSLIPQSLIPYFLHAGGEDFLRVDLEDLEAVRGRWGPSRDRPIRRGR